MSVKVCTRCVMDSTIKVIDFDEKGICNYCKTYEYRVLTELYKEPERTNKLNILIDKIKNDGFDGINIERIEPNYPESGISKQRNNDFVSELLIFEQNKIKKITGGGDILNSSISPKKARIISSDYQKAKSSGNNPELVKTVEELLKVQEVMKEHGMERGKEGLELYLMAELPSNIMMAEEFAAHIDWPRATGARLPSRLWRQPRRIRPIVTARQCQRRVGKADHPHSGARPPA